MFSLKRGVISTSITAAIAGVSSLVSVAPVTADINIGALACQPPFLAQAANLRWHEHYLINPNVPSSVDTWVVCNIAFDSSRVPETFYVGAFGNAIVPGTNALCYAQIVDIRNQHIPEGDFLPNKGQEMIFTKVMSTQNPANTLWSSWAKLTQTQVKAAMMDPVPSPVDPSATKDVKYWSIALSCMLKPGQALNTVSLWPTQ